MKEFYEIFFEHLLMPLDLEIKLHSRDFILKLQSLTHFQFVKI